MKNISSVFRSDGTGILIILIILFAGLSIGSPYFLTGENLYNLLLQSVFVMLVAFGMMFVLSSGGIDLSVGSVLGLCGGITGWLMMNQVNIWLAVLGGLIAGAIVGGINGLIITKLQIAPFLVTFAMLNIARGALLLFTIDKPIRNFSNPTFEFLAQGNIAGIPTAVVITFIVFVACYILFKWTIFGRYVTAVGSNSAATYLSGVPTNSVKIGVYVLSGVAAAISGILLSSRLTAVQPLMGESYEMNAIAAAVIGGTSMAGGKGSLLGTAIGAVILALISNGLDLLSVNQFYRYIITGLIIVVAVGVEQFAPKNVQVA